MKKLLVLLLGFLNAGLLIAQDPTLDELIAKFLQVKGQDKMANIQTVVFTGKITLKNKATVPFTITQKRPDLFRFEYDVQGTLVVYAGNEKASWVIDPSIGSTDPQDMPTKEAKKSISDYSDPYFEWENPFVNYNERGDKIELIGKEDLKGIPVYNIKMTSKDNDWVNFYMDAEKFLVLKVKYNVKSQGRTYEESQDYSDFRTINGLICPFKMEMLLNNQRTLTISVAQYDFNVPVFDLMFRKPVINK